MDKKHIIYKITNLLNGRFYIGMHTGYFDDGYLGSGKRIKREIKKYGRGNFKKEILEVLPTREELERREVELVSEEILADHLCLNLRGGGEGGWGHLNANTPENQLRRSRAGQIGGRHPSVIASLRQGRTSESTKKSAATIKLRYGDDFFKKIGSAPASDEKKKKLSLAQFGKRMIHNDEESKFVSSQEVEAYLQAGWKLGRRAQVL